jgi:hypothetical protein
MNSIRKIFLLSVCSMTAQLLTAANAADEHDRARPPERAAPHPAAARPALDGRGQVLDSRFNHGRYYPALGSVRPDLPGGYRPYFHGSDRFYFSGGVWYAPRGPGFVVVTPPAGLVISVLPPFYSTVWFGGVPYYYADNVYYTYQPDQNGYVVADAPPNANPNDSPPPDGTPPPDGAPPPGAAPSAQQMDLIIYPKNGQTNDQQAADRYECHTWAKGQTGFDPTQPAGGSPGNPDVGRSNYNRAMSACLQARGYQVN